MEKDTKPTPKAVPTLLIIRGIPGSGKSTIAKSLVDSGLFSCMFEADNYFMTADGYKYDKSKIKEAHQRCFDDTFSYLAKGYNAIVSNTFTSQWQYQKYLDKAREMGYNIQMIVAASCSFESVHNVPNETVDRMRKELADDLSNNFLLTT